MTSTTSTQPISNAEAPTSTSPTATATAQPATTAAAPTHSDDEHTKSKKHGVAALIEKVVHPSHHHGDKPHTHEHTDVASVPVAVPTHPSDGLGHLGPGGGGPVIGVL